MGGGKGGGSIDTSRLEEATNRSIDLQEEIYNQTRDDVQPWYQLGVGSTNRLADLLGVSGGSVQSREDIYNELQGQYTTNQGGGNLYTNEQGQVFDLSQSSGMGAAPLGANPMVYGRRRAKNNAWQDAVDSGDFSSYADQYGYTAVNQPTVDYGSLNAAVDQRLADQSNTPDDFGSLLERFGMDQFEEDPGYQFRKDEANKALERSMAAQGVTLGGAGYGDINPQAARATQELNQNLASQEYGSAYNRYVQDNLNIYNMLMGSAGLGQGSTGILATGGQNLATNVGNLTTGLASAQLNADLSNQANSSSMFSSLLGAGAQLGGALFSDIRVKKDIKRVGEENGYPIYTFKYIGGDTTHRGVMAQDVELIEPRAVKEVNGIKAVNYSMIGVDMEVVH